MGFSVREQALFAEVESVPGTAEALVGADVLQVQNLQPNLAENLRFLEREIIRSSLNPEQGVYGGALGGVQFDVELKGSGSAGSSPRLGDLLRGCGLSETIVTSTSVTYAPISALASHETLTIGYREGDNYRILRGCRGTFSMNLQSGQYGLITFNFIGRIHSETQTAAPTPSFETTVPPAFLGATFTVGGYAAKIQALTMDIQNNLVPGDNPNNADGFGDLVRITGRNTSGNINPEREGISTKDYVGIFRAGTLQAIQTGVIGGTAGNRWALAFPTAYFRNIEAANRDEILTYGIPFGAADTDGTDDFSIAFT